MATHIIPFEHTGRVQDPLLAQHRIEKTCSGLAKQMGKLNPFYKAAHHMAQGKPLRKQSHTLKLTTLY